MNNFLAALALLTIAPVRRPLDFSARAMIFFPLVGALLGVVLAGAEWLLRLVLPPPVAAALVVALWAFLTGGLHLDGVADACDALFAAVRREQRIEILRDVHVGAFGVIAVALVLLFKFAALPYTPPAALYLAPMLARWTLVYAATFPLARAEGMAALLRSGLGRRELAVATVFTLILTLPFSWLGASAWLAAVAISSLIARAAQARLGGLNGDVYGLACETVEATVLIVGSIFGS